MEFKLADEKSPQRREIRFSRLGRNQKASSPSSILEAIAQFNGGELAAGDEDGRMRIVVKKEDVKQVLEAIRDGRSLGRRAPAALEQRLNVMRRRQIVRAASQVMRGRSCRGCWRPALQSIPRKCNNLIP